MDEREQYRGTEGAGAQDIAAASDINEIAGSATKAAADEAAGMAGAAGATADPATGAGTAGEAGWGAPGAGVGAQDAPEEPMQGAGQETDAPGNNQGAGQETDAPKNIQGAGQEEPGAPEKKMSGAAKKFVAACLVVALCGGAGFGGAYGAIKLTGADKALTSTVNITGDTDSLNAASAIAEKTMPSVVGITTTTQTLTETIFGLQQGTSTGIGTGVIVDEDGYILTNAHVVEGSNSTYATGNPQVTVDLYDGSTYKGEVVWSDSSMDLAVVKIEATGLQAATIGDSDKVQIGDYAIAIGNPLGMNLERSVTQGIISGLDRTILAANGNTTNRMTGMIQTDAAINGGNSGGPLINSEGEVIGINTAGASSSGADGLGFAIPINTAKSVIDQIKATGSYEQPYLGIAGIDVSTVLGRYADQVNLKTTSGVYLAQIYTGSGAASAGLKEGDVITAIDGKEVQDMNSMKTILVTYKPGDTITLTIERDQKEMKVDVKLGSSNDKTTAITTNNSILGSGSGLGSGSSSGSGLGSGSGLNIGSGSGSSGLNGIFGN